MVPVFLALALLGPLSPQEQAVVDGARAAAVQVRATVSDSKDEQAICSGTIVGYDRSRADLIILTAKHCTVGDDYSTVTNTSVATQSGDVLAVDKVYRSAAADIAFIEVHTQAVFSARPHPAQFSFDEVQQGEGVFFYGMPAGTPWALQFARGAQGPIFNSTPDAPAEVQPLFSLDCPTCGPGDSGAAVFDKYGQIKGVLTMGRGSPQMIFYVPNAIVKIAYQTFLSTR